MKAFTPSKGVIVRRACEAITLTRDWAVCYESEARPAHANMHLSMVRKANISAIILYENEK